MIEARRYSLWAAVTCCKLLPAAKTFWLEGISTQHDALILVSTVQLACIATIPVRQTSPCSKISYPHSISGPMKVLWPLHDLLFALKRFEWFRSLSFDISVTTDPNPLAAPIPVWCPDMWRHVDIASATWRKSQPEGCTNQNYDCKIEHMSQPTNFAKNQGLSTG